MSNVREFSGVDDGSKKTRGRRAKVAGTHVIADGKSQHRASRGDFLPWLSRDAGLDLEGVLLVVLPATSSS